MDVSAASGADQVALSPLKIAQNQQEKNGEQALKLIESANINTNQAASPRAVDQGKGGLVDTFA